MNYCGDKAAVMNAAFCVKVLFGVWCLAALFFVVVEIDRTNSSDWRNWGLRLKKSLGSGISEVIAANETGLRGDVSLNESRLSSNL